MSQQKSMNPFSSYFFFFKVNNLYKFCPVDEQELGIFNSHKFTNEPRHDGFATSMAPDQPAHPRSLIRFHAVRYQFLYLL
jgi:hypothetical protein